jgi:hypothetical protein
VSVLALWPAPSFDRHLFKGVGVQIEGSPQSEGHDHLATRASTGSSRFGLNYLDVPVLAQYTLKALQEFRAARAGRPGAFAEGERYLRRGRTNRSMIRRAAL